MASYNRLLAKAARSLLGFAALACMASCIGGATDSHGLYRRIEASMDAADAIVESLRDAKVVFIPEAHAEVGAILFLAKNLRRFHEAGARVLFMEGPLPELPGSTGYGFLAFYPWTKSGWKHEWLILAQSVHELNSSLAEGDRLRVVYPEDGLASPASYDPAGGVAFLNRRDEYASAAIIAYLRQSREEDKALILYGSSHGARRKYSSMEGSALPGMDWKPMGAYLSEFYENRYIAYIGASVSGFVSPSYFSDADWDALRPMTKSLTLDSLRGTLLRKELLRYKDMPMFDALLVDREPVSGVFYQYVPSDENLRAMFEGLRGLERNPAAVAGDSSQFRFRPKGRYLLYLYYLKLYFGERFDYSLWNPEKGLDQALDELGSFAFGPGAKPSERSSLPARSIEALREYHRLMSASAIESYRRTGDPALLTTMEAAMKKAASIFPEDLWASYWLSFAQTKAGKYAEALEGWDALIANPLSSCMETLPRVYRMASVCAAALGSAEKAEAYALAARGCANEHGIETGGLLEFSE